MKATESEILLQMVHYEDRCWCVSQENQVHYDTGGGNIIFIAWIKFATLHFSFVSLVVISGSGQTR